MRNGIPDYDLARRNLEQVWDDKLQQARERYCRAAAEVFRCSIGNQGPPAKESAEAASLRRAEALAFAEYCRVLATFTELSAGEAPPPDSSKVVTMPRAEGEEPHGF